MSYVPTNSMPEERGTVTGIGMDLANQLSMIFKKSKKKKASRKVFWMVVTWVTSMGANAAAVAGAGRAWKSFRGVDPPEDAESPRTRWRDAIIWSGLVGMIGGVTAVGIKRAVAYLADKTDAPVQKN